MEYMFLIYADEAETARVTLEDRREIMSRHEAIQADARERGVLRGADRLQPSSAAMTARSGAGGVIFSDGPFAETKEMMGGYYRIECRDAEDARQWAGRIAATRAGLAVEFRPLFTAAVSHG